MIKKTIAIILCISMLFSANALAWANELPPDNTANDTASAENSRDNNAPADSDSTGNSTDDDIADAAADENIAEAAQNTPADGDTDKKNIPDSPYSSEHPASEGSSDTENSTDETDNTDDSTNHRQQQTDDEIAADDAADIETDEKSNNDSDNDSNGETDNSGSTSSPDDTVVSDDPNAGIGNQDSIDPLPPKPAPTTQENLTVQPPLTADPGFADLPEECGLMLGIFVRAMTAIPDITAITAFDAAAEAYGAAHRHSGIDSPLPAGAAEAYQDAFRAFAATMGMADEPVAYPDTSLETALQERTHTALNAYYNAMDAYTGDDFDALLTASPQLKDAKGKLNALLAIKPELIDTPVMLLAADTIQPIASEPENIRINLFNYGPLINTPVSGMGWMNFFQNETSYGPSVDTETTVSGGGGSPVMEPLLDAHPHLTNDNDYITAGSLQYLFDPDYTGHTDEDTYFANRHSGASDPYQYRSTYLPVDNADGSGTGLFQKDSDGYFIYDSAQNAAWYNPTTNKFELYDYVLRPSYTPWSATKGITVGNFLPFNKGHEQGVEDYQETKGEAIVPTKPTTDAATAYRLLGSTRQTETDLWFGMNMEFNFYMPKDGIVENTGKEMVFEFLGDDDVWVFIDNVLVLDIGGTHGAASGTINFATGTAEVINADGTTKYTKTFAELFGEAQKSTQFNSSGDTFRDYTKHNLKFFYMERGGNISYCKLKFNMDPLPTGSLSVTKQVQGVNRSLQDKDELYTFTVTAQDAQNQPLQQMTCVITDSSGYRTEETIANNGNFQLKDGQTATFTNLKVTDVVTIAEAPADYCTTTVRIDNAAPTEADSTPEITISRTGTNVIFTNTPDTGTLSISKQTDGKDRPGTAYTFTLSFDGTLYTGQAEISGTPHTVTNGELTLQADQTATITGIPYTACYTLSEQAVITDGYHYLDPIFTLNDKTEVIKPFGETITDRITPGNSTHQVTVTNRCRADLTIRKTGAAEIDGDQSFIFSVSDHTGTLAEVAIVGNGSATVKDLPLGEYTVSEAASWSWRYDAADQTADLTAGSTSVTIENKRGREHWLDGSTHCQNIFTTNPTARPETHADTTTDKQTVKDTMIATIKEDESPEAAVAAIAAAI